MDFLTPSVVAWSVLIAGILLAALGTILPGLPGTFFIVIAVIVHKTLLPEVFSWGTVIAITVLSLLSWLVDVLSGVVGAKLGGATKQGLIGATIGGFIGIFFGLPGLILGPFLGAIIGDIYGKRSRLKELLLSGGGASLGFVISLVSRFVLLLVIVIIIVVAAIV